MGVPQRSPTRRERFDIQSPKLIRAVNVSDLRYERTLENPLNPRPVTDADLAALAERPDRTQDGTLRIKVPADNYQIE